MAAIDWQLSSPFNLNTPTKSIVISEESADISASNTSASGEGTVLVNLVPRPSLEIEVRSSQPLEGLMERGKEKMVLSGKHNVPGFVGRVGEGLTWIVTPEPIVSVGDENATVSKVVFHLANFRHFLSAHETFESVDSILHKISHLILEWNGFTVHLRSLPSTKDTTAKLRDFGGYGVTHLGEILKKDGTDFLANEATPMLQAIRYFFSFAIGAWASPFLSLGFDSAESRVWEEWNSPFGEPYLYTHSWFDSFDGSQLESLFPAFMDIWMDAQWQPALEEALYWYLCGNLSARGVDVGIILTQAAIERMAFTLDVEKGGKSDVLFRKETAADHFRNLLSPLNIPLSIPSGVSELLNLNTTFKWQDGPHALTDVRNELVHPVHKKKGLISYEAYIDAWNLCCWYIEMTVLALCKYNGEYSNRLIPGKAWGQFEKVPWVP